MKGEIDLKISAKKQDGAILLQTAASKPYTIRLMNVTGVAAMGASTKKDGNDTIVIPSADRIEIRLEHD